MRYPTNDFSLRNELAKVGDFTFPNGVGKGRKNVPKEFRKSIFDIPRNAHKAQRKAYFTPPQAGNGKFEAIRSSVKSNYFSRAGKTLPGVLNTFNFGRGGAFCLSEKQVNALCSVAALGTRVKIRQFIFNKIPYSVRNCIHSYYTFSFSLNCGMYCYLLASDKQEFTKLKTRVKFCSTFFIRSYDAIIGVTYSISEFIVLH